MPSRYVDDGFTKTALTVMKEGILTHLPRILPTFLILASKMSSALIYLKKIDLL